MTAGQGINDRGSLMVGFVDLVGRSWFSAAAGDERCEGAEAVGQQSMAHERNDTPFRRQMCQLRGKMGRDCEACCIFSGLPRRRWRGKLSPMKPFRPKPSGGREAEARQNRHVKSVAAESVAVPSLDEDDLLTLLQGKSDPLVLILDCIQDVHNLGAILRTADGAGVTAVVAPRDKAASITETVRRVSTGAADWVPFVQVTNLARTMEKLKEAGVWIVGTSDRAQKSLYQTALTGPLALVMGAEGKGMRRLTEENCDFLVKLPMAGRVECLNVSVATGICLYEAVRQRQGR